MVSLADEEDSTLDDELGLAELLVSVLGLEELLDSTEAEEELGPADEADSLVAGDELEVSLVGAADEVVATSEVEDSAGSELEAADDELSRTGPLEVAFCPELVDEAEELELYEPYGG